MYRQWLFLTISSVFFLCFTAGIFQLIFVLKNKIIKIIISILFILFLIFFLLPILLVSAAFGINEERVIEKNGQKYLIYIHNFHRTSVFYYNYKGPFLSGSRILFKEYYGKTGFDPDNPEANIPKDIKFYYCKQK